jgi:arylsulfatase A-like enzyme
MLLYVIDTLRADHLGYHGDPYAFTPHMDRFAGEGTVFTRAYASSSWTRASMASLFTGVQPLRHGTEGRRDSLPANISVLPELLRDAGYRTAFIATNPNVSSFFGFGRGFDEMIELYSRPSSEGEILPEELITKSDEVTRHAIEWMKTAPQPFFLAILTIDPHLPYTAPPRFMDAARKSTARDSRDRRFRKFRRARRERRLDYDLGYRAEIALNDESFGSLLEWMRESSLLDETVVVLTADHGEEFWEHGHLQHGKNLFEEVLHVPLVVRHAGSPLLRPGQRIERPVRNIDAMPTLLEIAGIASPPELDATSLIGDSAPDDSHIYAKLRLDGFDMEAIYEHPWKLVLDRGSGTEALFDLEKDPDEYAPIPEAGSQVASAARRRLRGAIEMLPHPVRGGAEAAPEDLPEEARRALEALGYLQ